MSLAHLPRPPRRLLGVWAHPDDETYVSGGLMARVVDAGGHVVVLAATDGELGFPDDHPGSPRERAALRRAEMDTAMAELGVHDICYLGLPDGSLNTFSADLEHRIALTIEAVRPDVIVTFGPDGATGHPDHVAVSAATTAAWLVSGGSADLLYACETADWYAEFHDVHDRYGVWMGDEPEPTPADRVAVRLDLGAAELDRKRRALAGHSSQTDGIAAAMGEARYRSWWRRETFRRPHADEIGRAVPGVAHRRTA